MKLIDRVYISGYRYDTQFTQACVACIRHFYPSIPITLIKDRRYGDYSTKTLEKHFNCDVFNSRYRVYGWGFGKLEPLFLEDSERFLVLDSDVLLLGKAINRLQALDHDFVVQLEEGVSPEFIESNYFDLSALNSLDPTYRYPGFTFNTGQWVGRSGLFTRNELAQWINWSGSVPSIRHPEIFKLGEQGFLNYLLVKASSEQRCTLHATPFMTVGKDLPSGDKIPLKNFLDGESEQVAHWCGCRAERFEDMHRGDLWIEYEKLYYKQLPWAKLIRFTHDCSKWSHRTKMTFRKWLRRLVVSE